MPTRGVCIIHSCPGFILLRYLPFSRKSAIRDRHLVDRVRANLETFRTLSSQSLVRETDRLRGEVRRVDRKNVRWFSSSLRERKYGVKHDVILDAIALIAEAVHRVSGKSYYDVQLLAGWKLCQGTIAEIQTGEGKTLITAIPAFVFALAGRGVHVATTNDYLSRRDFETNRPAFRLLGMTTSHLDTGQDDNLKRAAYACDITYGPGYEYGFDYLRDQIQRRKSDRQPLGDRFVQQMHGHRFESAKPVQRRCAFAIIDEADSVLIDEANTPLVLGGQEPGPQTDPELYRIANQFAASLSAHTDYEKLAGGIVQLTEAGTGLARAAFEKLPRRKMSRSWSVLVQNALKAHIGFTRDVDYVVQDGEVRIVDVNTGRIHKERRWQSGLHQAIEVACGLTPSVETITQARITRQRYCQYYQQLCGLTGTAGDNAIDFRTFYGLDVAVVETHRPCQRKVLASRYFANRDDKHRYLVIDAVGRSNRGQPVLVGTRSIRESHAIAEAFRSHGSTSHAILNGVQDEQEAHVIGRAGRHGAITIATNMAGRGTDIAIGDRARACGGLHVIAAEHHESSRVDRQLAGRAARQGDPGSVQFLTSADDKLIHDHDDGLADRLRRIKQIEGVNESSLDAAIGRLQKSIEQKRFRSRQTMVARDAWLEKIQNTLAKTG
ncbi:preprotein translocase subunit SecA [Novipirellula artificiosorum]|uniref:Protein translocase subunit SecA n=1 Tax=Novipirellula artificiosorum TaxID=2528016 RepID=A0A5C6D7Y4_9BACT|nr:preprotein translocase subunit SecA [Novipirellula artificiosorum]TWU31964.1 preprotein translocase subunit SecA [Novipirellula artificiosorum]